MNRIRVLALSLIVHGGPPVASGARQKIQIFYHSAMSANDS